MDEYTENYLLDKRVKIFQPQNGYRASTDAVLLAAALKNVSRGDSVLDVGSGTGAVSLCLAERFKNAGVSITGLELQSLLCGLSNQSAAANGFDFLHYENCNIFESGLPFCSFNHVVTNPPYSENDLPSPNQSKAAAHNFSHKGLNEWINFCIKMLRPQGYFYMINRGSALAEIMAALHGRLGAIEVIPLFSKPLQSAKRIIIRARKDSNAPLILHRGLTLHQPDGEYSEAARQILRQGAPLE